LSELHSPQKVLLVHYGEIALKGGNRSLFENRMLQNVRAAIAPFGQSDVRKTEVRFIVYPKTGGAQTPAFDDKKALTALSRVFGVESVSPAIAVAPDIGLITEAALSQADSLGLRGKSIRVECKRSNKSFPLNSQQVNMLVGKALVDAGCSVDLDNPDETVFIEILKDKALVAFGRIRGPGGLPVGSSGRVLSLLSGGIDSPAASWLMMKRGCDIDLLHVHQFAGNKDAKSSKIMRLARLIRGFSPHRVRLYLVPYLEFYKKTTAIQSSSELVVFRRFLLRLGNALAAKEGYLGMVTGDSLGQVASQTLENLYATDEVAALPVFRPLIGYNKQEIVSLAMRIGTFDTSIEPYKDCCSLVATKNPSTRVPLEKAKRIEQEIEMEKIVERTLADMEVVEL